MRNDKAIDILNDTMAMVETPALWSKNAQARDSFNQCVDVREGDVHKRSLHTALCAAVGILPGEKTANQAAFVARDALRNAVAAYFYTQGKPKAFVNRYKGHHCLAFFNDYPGIDHSAILWVIKCAISTLKQQAAA